MSTLTKILIILLTLSSIFLCGVVVTYVANADNYRQKYDGLKAERDSFDKKLKSLTKQTEQNADDRKRLEVKYTGQITSLKAQLTKAENDLKDSEREKASLLQKVNSWTSITQDFYQTTDKQGQLLKNTLDELSKAQAEQAKQKKELKETTDALVQKMAIIKTLEADKRRLLEEKAQLQTRLDQLLQPTGQAAYAPVPVTPRRDTARAATPVGRDIVINGLVTAVDLKNSMVSISVGRADGVKEGMRLHVTRADEFICDVLIIDIEPEQAVGVLELVQKQPKVGDNVSTSL